MFCWMTRANPTLAVVIFRSVSSLDYNVYNYTQVLLCDAYVHHNRFRDDKRDGRVVKREYNRLDKSDAYSNELIRVFRRWPFPAKTPCTGTTHAEYNNTLQSYVHVSWDFRFTFPSQVFTILGVRSYSKPPDRGNVDVIIKINNTRTPQRSFGGRAIKISPRKFGGDRPSPTD